MKKAMLRKVLLVSVLVLMGGMALPVLGFTTDIQPQAATCGGISCTGTLDRVYTSTSGIVYIGTDGDERNLACVASEGVYVTLRPNQPLFREIYDSLLAGLIHNKTMIVRIVQGSDPCRLSYVTLDR